MPPEPEAQSKGESGSPLLCASGSLANFMYRRSLMSTPPDRNDVTVDVIASPSVEVVRQQFEAAWEEALSMGTRPPELDSFLGGLDTADLLALRRELAHVAQSYQERLSQTKLPQAHTPPLADDPTLTADLPTAPSDETVNAPSAVQDPARTGNIASDQTVDAVPALDPNGRTAEFHLPDPQDTVDHTDDGYEEDATEPMDQPRDKLRTPQIAGYDVVGVLGRGAMGVVYKARQRGLKRLVALKMILAGDHASERDLARFKIEAEAVAQFQHPNIVQIYEIGEHDGKPFFSLEFVEGDSLAKKVSGSPLPAREAAEIIRAMALAMQYAHEKGIIHRDLKPANVLLTKVGQPKITDFGLAKRLDEDSGQTRHGSVLGTPSYMPPEQAEGRLADVGPLSDVYSLGAILYELLTGRAPFRAATLLETLSQVRRQEPVSPIQLQPGTPRDLETISLKCLQKDPAKRYANAGELAADLQRYLNNEPIKARPVPLYEHALRWCRRNPVVASLSGAVALLILTALIGSGAFSLVIWNEKEATAKAKKESDDHAAAEKQNAILANLEKDRANKQTEETKKSFNVAVDRFISLGGEAEKLLRNKADNPQAEAALKPVREQLLTTVRNHMTQLARQLEAAGVTSQSSLRAHQALGDLFKKLGMSEQAAEQYDIAYKEAKALAEQEQPTDVQRGNLAVMLTRLGDLQIELHADLPAGGKWYQEALDVQQNLEANQREHFYSAIKHGSMQAFSHVNLGRVALANGDPTAARMHFDQAATFRRNWLKDDEAKKDPKIGPDSKDYLAEADLEVANACWRLGDLDAVNAALKEALGLMEPLIAADGKYAGWMNGKADVAELYLVKGDALFRQGDVEGARAQYEKCVPLLGAAINKDPEDLRYNDLVSRLKYRQGLVAMKTEDVKEAARVAEHFGNALKFCTKLTTIYPANLPYQTTLTLCLARAGKTADAVKKADALKPQVAKDPELLIQLAGCYALCSAAAPNADDKKMLTDKAMTILRDVTKAGYKDRVNLQTDPNLTPLADDATFKEIVAQPK